MNKDVHKALSGMYKHAVEELYPKMEDSAMCLSIWSDKPDPKICMEIGAAVCFNKPIIVCVFRGEKVPSSISRIASAIVEVDMDDMERSKKRLTRAIQNVLKYDARTKKMIPGGPVSPPRNP